MLKSVIHPGESGTGTAQKQGELRWWALVVLALAQFLVVLDASIVNIALPELGMQLSMDTTALSWVITAYVLPFGGLLLLGGRLGDQVGHRRIFIIGLAGFLLSSAAAGLSTSGFWLLVARAVQGASAALLAPAALSLVTRLFAQPGDRAKALGIWGAVAGIGSAAGVLLGGLLTSAFGWSAVFFINVPIGLAVIVAIPFLVARDTGETRVKTDFPGAFTVTAGLSAFVAGLSLAESHGLTAPLPLALIAGSMLLLAAFAVIETKSAEPLVPFRIFRIRPLLAGNLTMLLVGGATTGLFFALSVYMQQVLQYNALIAGLTQLPLALALVAAAGVIPWLMNKLGSRRALALSLTVFAAGLIWLSFADQNAGFLRHLLGPTLVLGVGLGGSFVAGTQLAVEGAGEQEAGLASGLVNTSQQIGGAVGLVVLGAIATGATNGLLEAGIGAGEALSAGFSRVFMGAAVFAAAGAVIALTVKARSTKRPLIRSGLGR